MPFTGSHPAAVLLFARWGLPSSALVIGSMVPDLPYFAPVPFDGVLTHSPAGVIGADLVLGGMAFVVWQALVAPAMVDLAPTGLRQRLRPGQPASLRYHLARPYRVLLVVVALVLGSVTHVVWDSFTHYGRWGSVRLGWLGRSFGPLPGFRWAQYASGMLGAAILAAWLVHWWRSHPPLGSPGPSRAGRGVLWALTAAVMIVGAGLSVSARLSQETDRLRGALFLAVTGAGSAGLAAILAVAIGWTVRPRRRSLRGAGPHEEHVVAGRRDPPLGERPDPVDVAEQRPQLP